MRNIIEQLYNISIRKLIVKDDKYYFVYKNERYKFVKLSLSEKLLEEKIKISNELFNMGVKVNTFILNKDKNYITNVNSENYVLQRIYCDKDDIVEIEDILRFNNKYIKTDKEKIEYKQKWQKIVDEYEQQILEYNNEFPILCESFNYFVGLAENAIKYLDSFPIDNNKDDLICLSHHRVTHCMSFENFYDPLNFMFDYKIRDLSEFVKSTFFIDNDLIEEEYILNLFIREKISNYLVALFIARLIFPTYYFDIFLEIINGTKNEEDLKIIIEKTKEYEDFLYKLITKLQRNYNIPILEWIAKLE